MKWGSGQPPLFFTSDFWISGGRVAEDRAKIERELESRIEALGFEMVELRWGGQTDRPILRLRVDRPDSRPGLGITVQDCAVVSRGLESWLDELAGFPERYTLEVSSPGVERPLARVRDFKRFSGHEVKVTLARALGDQGKVLEGKLGAVALEEGADEGMAQVELEVPGHGMVCVSLGDVVRANLVYRWENDE
jgi:ribosome maturation factor RimP